MIPRKQGYNSRKTDHSAQSLSATYEVNTMSDCCASSCPSPAHPNRHTCPGNRKEYAAVGTRTILHHLKQPWTRNLVEQHYYFCDDPNCDVVYFGEDNSVIVKDDLRTQVGQKESSPSRTLCYCFGVLAKDAINGAAKDFVVIQTKNAVCSCETSNPSGQCCLKDFPKS